MAALLCWGCCSLPECVAGVQSILCWASVCCRLCSAWGDRRASASTGRHPWKGELGPKQGNEAQGWIWFFWVFFNENKVIVYKKWWYLCVLRILRFPQIWSFKMFTLLLSMKPAHRTALCVYIYIYIKHYFSVVETYKMERNNKRTRPEFKMMFQTMEHQYSTSGVDTQGWEHILPWTSLWRGPAGCTEKLKTR